MATRKRRHDSIYLGGYAPASPFAWGAARFGAVQRQQARLDRLPFRLLDESEGRTPALEEEGGVAPPRATAHPRARGPP